MYAELKAMMTELTAVEECHPTAEHFRNVIDKAIRELDAVAEMLEREINELRHLEDHGTAVS
jgi:hypothetical protein